MTHKPDIKELELRIKALENQYQKTRETSQDTKDAARNHKRFLKFLPYPVLVRDAKKLVTYLNPAFTKTFGWTLKELRGKKGTQYVPESLKDELSDKIKNLPSNKSVLQLTARDLQKMAGF